MGRGQKARRAGKSFSIYRLCPCDPPPVCAPWPPHPKTKPAIFSPADINMRYSRCCCTLLYIWSVFKQPKKVLLHYLSLHVLTWCLQGLWWYKVKCVLLTLLTREVSLPLMAHLLLAVPDMLGVTVTAGVGCCTNMSGISYLPTSWPPYTFCSDRDHITATHIRRYGSTFSTLQCERSTDLPVGES